MSSAVRFTTSSALSEITADDILIFSYFMETIRLTFRVNGIHMKCQPDCLKKQQQQRFDAYTELGAFMRIKLLCISVLRVASAPRMKLASCESALTPLLLPPPPPPPRHHIPVVYSTDRSKAVFLVLFLLFVALWFPHCFLFFFLVFFVFFFHVQRC